MSKSEFVIREATVEDIHFITEHAYRLVEFGPPPWRDQTGMTKTDIEVITTSIANKDNGKVVYIAIDESGQRHGFIHLTTAIDYFTRHAHGHISDLVVVKEAEGKGVGKLLLTTAEEWAKSNGFKWITLSVFEKNTKAKGVYERAGFQPDTIKYVKEL